MDKIDVADTLRIRELIDLYFHALDTTDFELLAECFVPDAVMSYFGGSVVQEGRDVFIGKLKTLFDFQASTHTLANMRIRRTAEGVVGDVVASAHLLTHDNKMMVRGLQYSDIYVQVAGAWKIKRRAHRATWQFDTGASSPITAVQLESSHKRG